MAGTGTLISVSGRRGRAVGIGREGSAEEGCVGARGLVVLMAVRDR